MIVNEGCRRQIVLGALIWRRLFGAGKGRGKAPNLRTDAPTSVKALFRRLTRPFPDLMENPRKRDITLQPEPPHQPPKTERWERIGRPPVQTGKDTRRNYEKYLFQPCHSGICAAVDATALSTATPRMQPSDHAGSNFLLAQAECNADETPETCAARQAQEEVAPPTQQPAPEAPAEQPAEAPVKQPAPEVPAENPLRLQLRQRQRLRSRKNPRASPAEDPHPNTRPRSSTEPPKLRTSSHRGSSAEQSDQPAPTPQAPAAPAPEAPAPEQPAAEQPVQPAPEQPGRPAPEQQAPGPEAPTSEQPALAPAAPSAPAPAEPATPAPAAPAPAGPATQQPAQWPRAAVPAEGAASPVLDSQKRPRNRQGGGQQPAPEQARPSVPVEPAGPPPADDRAAAEAAQPAEVVPVTREQGTRRERAPEAPSANGRRAPRLLAKRQRRPHDHPLRRQCLCRR